MPSGSMRESMHVTTATPAWATPSNPLSANEAANDRFAASRSSNSPTTRDLCDGLGADAPEPSDQLVGLTALGGVERRHVVPAHPVDVGAMFEEKLGDVALSAMARAP